MAVLGNSPIFAFRFFITMGTKHKILEDFYDESFVLIALHCDLEDHILVYALNANLKTRFKRSKHDIDSAENFSFPMFEWFDEKNDSHWALFPNGTLAHGENSLDGLFKNMPASAKRHLVPEHKEVDYFIKIDQPVDDTFIKRIQRMPRVLTAYEIDCDKLSSKNNLIF